MTEPASPFCEGRYFLRYPFPFADEFVSAVSSLALTVVALGPPYPPRLGAPLWLARSALGICGIGSTLYHARLDSRLWKLTDEIPMVLVAGALSASFLWSLSAPRYRGLIAAGATLYGLVTVLVDVVVTTTPLPFQVLFIAPFVGMIPLLVRIWARLHRWLPGVYVRRLYTQLAAAATVGAGSWLIDAHACSVGVAILRLHAWWHVAIAYTAYLLIVIAALARGKVLLEWRGCSWPTMIEKPLLIVGAGAGAITDATNSSQGSTADAIPFLEEDGGDASHAIPLTVLDSECAPMPAATRD